MENDAKVALGLGVAGICIGATGLAFGWLAYTHGEEFDSDLSEIRSNVSEMQVLLEKVREIEEDSSGLYAHTQQLASDLSSLRETTQEALDSAGSQITRLRGDFNENVRAIRTLEAEIEDIDDWIAHVESLPGAVATAASGSADNAPSTDQEQTSGSTEETAERETERASGNGKEEEFSIHIVQAGETMTSIAGQHGVSLNDLLHANEDVDPARMQIGQEIRVPAR